MANDDAEISYFGGCPHCGRTDGYLNIRRGHWFVCHTHRTRWLAGANLFSSWRHETESLWKENYLRIAGYKIVEPIHEPLGPAKKPE